MDNDRDLDRLIDEAARQMVQHEPSHALSSAVMERISAPATPFARRGLMWGSLAAAVVISAAVMFVEVNRTARSTEAPQQAQGSGLKTQGPKMEGSGLRAQEQAHASGLRAQGLASSHEAQSLAVVARTAADAVAEIGDRITLESITPAPIEVDRLKVALTPTIDPIEIAPLQVEPLSATD